MVENMETSEIKLVEDAQKLIPVLEMRLSRLKALVAAYSSFQVSASVKKEAELQIVTRQDGMGNVTPLLLPVAEFSDVEMPISDWIRTAIQMANGHSFTNPWIFEKIKELNKDAANRVTSGRISTELFNLAKNEEIIAVNKNPGHPSEYQITNHFRPVRKYRRTQPTAFTEATM
jgi:hypothetical protein